MKARHIRAHLLGRALTAATLLALGMLLGATLVATLAGLGA
jgi:hypothetical protein